MRRFVADEGPGLGTGAGSFVAEGGWLTRLLIMIHIVLYLSHDFQLLNIMLLILGVAGDVNHLIL